MCSSHLTYVEHVTIEEVFDAYFECRKHKRRTVSAARFEIDFVIGCYNLWKELNSDTYKIGKSITFCVTVPKIREVFAADFRDRIIHHLIIGKFNNIFESEMLDSSYACRKGRGTLYGARSLQSDMQAIGGDGWYARCDIQGFFMSINRDVLMDEIERLLRKNNISDADWWLKLIKTVVMNRPENNCDIHGNRRLWDRLPQNKSLFHSNGVGLPIGNLTSQVFANVYMSMFDRWVVGMLGPEGRYSRYVDDFVVLHKDKQVVVDIVRQAREWLRKELKLTLHPKKVCIQQIHKALRFTGVCVRTNCILPSKRLTEGTYKLINDSLDIPSKTMVTRMNSRIGLMVNYSSYNLRRRIWRALAAKNENRYICINHKKIKERKKKNEKTVHQDKCTDQ